MRKNGRVQPPQVSGDQSKQCQLSVVIRPIREMKLNPKNPRVHTKRQIRQIARSIEGFGFLVPVLVDRHDHVVAGHGRIHAALQLGWHEVPTIHVDHLTESQARAFMLADNKLSDNSCWDERLLAEQFKILAAEDLDFSLEVTGFDMGEIDLWIEGFEARPEGTPDPVDTLPAPESGPPVSRLGDLWCLGPHRLLCGNALEAESYRILMRGQAATLVFTDPPYNVPIDGHASGLGRIKHRNFPMASGELSKAGFTTFLTQALSQLAAHSLAGALHFICMDWRHLGEVLTAGSQVYTELKNVCVWVKDRAGMGSMYRSHHEFVLVFKHGKAPHRNNVQLGRYGRSRSNVWHYPSATSFSRATDEGHLLSLHPTVKPVRLVADALLDGSTRGDLILDAFVGSGTTLIAAERTGRIVYGLELDPRYVDTAVRRWQTYTGDHARHAVTGRRFDELVTKGGKRHATR